MAGVLLAFFFGVFGIHKFYLGQTGWGIVYALFFWTGIPAIAGFIECFLMPGRVRAYNAAQAQLIAAGILASSQPTASAQPLTAYPAAAAARTCTACGGTMDAAAAFCTHCGVAAAEAS